MAFRNSRAGHIAGEDISAYVDEELSSSATQRVSSHLQTCNECRALADDLRSTKTLIHEQPLMRAPRDFSLGPQFAAAPVKATPYTAPRRGWFNFMPAVAMSAALLLLLVFVDLAAISPSSRDGSGTDSESSAGARAIEDASRQSAESTTQQQPMGVPPAVPRAGQPAPQPGSAGAPGSAGTPQTLQAAPAATPMTAQAPAPPPPATGSPAAANTFSPPTPAPVTTRADESSAGDEDEDRGIGLLRVLQVLAGAALIGSIGGLIWQKRQR